MSNKSKARAEAAQRRQRRRRLWLIGGLAAVVVLAGALTLWGLTARSRDAEAKVVASGEDIQRIAPLDAKAMLDRGEALLYDVRARSSYETEHAAGALALPEAELDALAPSLPKDKGLVLY
jgi:predicted metal-binding membrane protein